jgi:enhancing lycopene biosynthesis protein 2
MNVFVEDCPPNDYITDRYNKILTTPCSLHLGAKPDEILKGISGLVREFVEMA